MNSILVPLDGSPLSEQALPLAIRLARALGGTVQLVHILDDSLELSTDGDSPIVGADSYLRDIQRTLSNDVRTNTSLIVGTPSDEILELAEHTPGAIIVMSTHGRRGLRRLVTGSVTDAVLRRATVPVAVVRAGLPSPDREIQTIVVALDGSELAESSLPVAITLARRSGALLSLVRVVEPIAAVPFATYGPATAYVPYHEAILAEEQLQADARAYMTRVAEELRGQDIRVIWELRTGHPAEEIMRLAETISADLVLTTTHGHGGIKRMALGSVTTELILKGSVPILNVPPPTPDDTQPERLNGTEPTIEHQSTQFEGVGHSPE